MPPEDTQPVGNQDVRAKGYKTSHDTSLTPVCRKE